MNNSEKSYLWDITISQKFKQATLSLAIATLLTACGSSKTVDPEDVLESNQASAEQDTGQNTSQNSGGGESDTNETDQNTDSSNPEPDAETSPDNSTDSGDAQTTEENAGSQDSPGEQTQSGSEPATEEPAQTVFTSSSEPGFKGTILDDGNVQIEWPAVDGAKGYNLYRAGEYLTSVSEPSYLDTDISASSYYYEVDSYDFNDNIERYAEGLTVTLSPALGAAVAGDNASVTTQTPGHILDEYELVFSDEFQADSLDTTKWNTSYLWGTDLFINSEEQYYVDINNDPDFGFDPFSFDGEYLTINSIRTPDDLLDKAQGQKYLSGVMTSYDSFQFTYGYVEARVKVPFGQGFWSAFWLLNAYYVDSKPEIDIMEHIGNDRDVAYHTYHYYDSDGKLHSTKSMETVGVDFTADFHTFAAEWKPGKIIFYVDGIERHSVSDPSVSSQSMYIIANTALGGWWPGPPDEWTPFPAEYKIDYIRAYQKRGIPEDQPFNDGIQTIPFADDIPGKSPNHIPSPEQWPEGYPELGL